MAVDSANLHAYVLEEVREHIARASLSPDDLRQRLRDEDLELLARKTEPDVDCPTATFERLVAVLEWVEGKSGTSAESAARVADTPAEHAGSIPHEVLELRVLLVKFDAAGTLCLRNLLEESSDTRFELGQARELDSVPRALEGRAFDVAIVDCTVPGEAGLELLARNELIAAPVPVIPLIRPEAEAQALHLGSRDYLVREGLTTPLAVRTLRAAVERKRLHSELERAQSREHFHATRDSMSGLPNRCYFHDQLGRALDFARSRSEEVSVLFVDLDGFKGVNDSLGHTAGDRLLLGVCERMAAALPNTDLLARVGGDEFLILLQPRTEERDPAETARALLASLEDPIRCGELEHHVGASVGVATFPRDGEDADTLIHNADAALYRAKAEGKGRYQLYDPSANAQVLRRLGIESRMRQSLEDGRFALHYQPRLRVDTGQVVGAEALLRWTDPEWGAIGPAEFIPVAEDSGLIVPLGDWVLREALRQQRAWLDAGLPPVAISINVSPRQIAENSLRETFLGALWETAIDPSCVEIEVTETVLMRNPAVAASVLGELNEIGIRLALDDFGTGFSSLEHLKRFPVDTIKIDQCFVRDVCDDPDDALITEAIISIGEKLRLHVVAEGVETRGQRDFLLTHGCKEMQGFFFSRPVPAEAFGKIVARAAAAGRLAPHAFDEGQKSNEG